MIIDSKKLEMAMARNCIDKVGLAEKAGISTRSIQRSVLKSGSKPETVGKIAKALGVDPSEITKD